MSTDLLTLFLIGAVVFLTFTIEGISGFGSTVLALPFITMLVGLENSVPLLSTLGLVLALFVVSRNWRIIGWRELRFILLCVLPGVPVGLVIASELPQALLMIILTLFMISIGVRGLFATWKEREVQKERLRRKAESFLMGAALFCGGVMQGAFSSGGPLVVIYAAETLRKKSVFRATLSSLWLITNLTMLTKWTIDGKIWNMHFGSIWFSALPFVIGGIFFGNFLHHKVNEYIFRLLVYAALNIAAIVMFINAVLNKSIMI